MTATAWQSHPAEEWQHVADRHGIRCPQALEDALERKNRQAQQLREMNIAVGRLSEENRRLRAAMSVLDTESDR